MKWFQRQSGQSRRRIAAAVITSLLGILAIAAVSRLSGSETKSDDRLYQALPKELNQFCDSDEFPKIATWPSTPAVALGLWDQYESRQEWDERAHLALSPIIAKSGTKRTIALKLFPRMNFEFDTEAKIGRFSWMHSYGRLAFDHGDHAARLRRSIPSPIKVVPDEKGFGTASFAEPISPRLDGIFSIKMDAGAAKLMNESGQSPFGLLLVGEPVFPYLLPWIVDNHNTRFHFTGKLGDADREMLYSGVLVLKLRCGILMDREFLHPVKILFGREGLPSPEGHPFQLVDPRSG
jgi:hypothetical protein